MKNKSVLAEIDIAEAIWDHGVDCEPVNSLPLAYANKIKSDEILQKFTKESAPHLIPVWIKCEKIDEVLGIVSYSLPGISTKFYIESMYYCPTRKAIRGLAFDLEVPLTTDQSKQIVNIIDQTYWLVLPE